MSALPVVRLTGVIDWLAVPRMPCFPAVRLTGHGVIHPFLVEWRRSQRVSADESDLRGQLFSSISLAIARDAEEERSLWDMAG